MAACAARHPGSTSRRIAIAAATVAVAAAASHGATALAQPRDEEPLALEGFFDRLDDVVKVSTVPPPLIGAVSSGSGNLVAPQLRIPVPELTQDTVCVRTQSRDGTYEARGELSKGVLVERNGKARWTYKPTKYLPYLLKASADDLAVLASMGACNAEGRSQSIAVVMREAATERSDSVVLYMHAPDHVIDVRWRAPDGAARQVECTGFQDQKRSTAFHKLCRMQGPFAPITDIEVEKRRPGTARSELISYRLLYAQPQR